jgi:hypothetical protein
MLPNSYVRFNFRDPVVVCRRAPMLGSRWDLRGLHGGAGVANGARLRLPSGVGDDDAVLLHVVEEFFQHLGKMEVTKDVLLHA